MALARNTVQQTLCIPLWCRARATETHPSFFPDSDAARIFAELGAEPPKGFLYRLEYPSLQTAIRQYDMACELADYVRRGHPRAAIVELGAGLSCLRRQIARYGLPGAGNPWYAVDLPDVIELREGLIPDDGTERRISCDLNDFSWMDAVDFNPADGVVFFAAGLFYYFRPCEVEALVAAMAERFPGGALAFDATSARGIRGVNHEVKQAGNETRSYFSLEDPVKEVAAWSPRIAHVHERDYWYGYAEPRYMPRMSLLTRGISRHMRRMHLGFIVHADFADAL